MMYVALALVGVALIIAGAYLLDKDDIVDAYQRLREMVLNTLAKPRRLLVWALILFLVDLILGGPIMTRVNALSLGNQLTLIIAIATLVLGYKPAQWLHAMIYSTNDIYLLVLNPTWRGYLDLITMSPEVRDEYTIVGADSLYRKPIPIVGEILICWKIHADTKEIISTWKACPDPTEVEEEKGALESLEATIEGRFEDWKDDLRKSSHRKRVAAEDANLAIANLWDDGERIDGQMTLKELYDRAEEEDIDPGEVTISLADTQQFKAAETEPETGGEAA